MPRYDYSCAICGENFEKNLSYNSNPSAVVCPRGHTNVRRVYSAPSIVFKGSGWYATDQKSSGKGKAVSTEAG
jgi:putative FmdB family regulatory protein